ncbi:uncharacterized protein LOC105248682 [Camponotus floridanus]|uniref:uncharacterized protein LOC105248682 n=1 Tax=Camponotus floridanus TaxID=104421 RepID=UPI000DC6BF14|nr:uncharacterized protein LOC105248682 [Camponotus floridanus]
MLSRAVLFVNLKTEVILRICAKITCENSNNRGRILRIISKCDEMRDTTKQNSKMRLIMTDTFFSIPQGKLVFRQFKLPDRKGALMHFKPYYSLATSLPRLINNYECVSLDKDLTYALACVLMISLNIEKHINRRMFKFLLPDFVNIFIEHIPTVGNFVCMQVVVKSAQNNVHKSCNDALKILKNLMQELSITEDELIFP